MCVIPLKTEFPPLGLVEMEDTETGKRMTVNTSSSDFARSYKEQMLNERTKVKTALTKSGVDHFFIHTDQDIFKQLMKFVKTRRER